MKTDFLPVNKDELAAQGAAAADFVVVTGDAYVDHPSFGAAVIGRLLQSKGYSVGVIAQPAWNDAGAFKVFGEPKLGFLVTGGNIDSMVSHYTAAKKRRSKDLYSPGGRAGLRPDRAATVYCNKIREAYRSAAIILGGLEASLRRLAHYDYWDDKLRRSVLLDSGADLLVYGMGERQTLEIAEALASGVPVGELTSVRGTVYKTGDISEVGEHIRLPDFDALRESKRAVAESVRLQYENTDHITGQKLVEYYGGVYAVQNAPAPPLTEAGLDAVHALGYTRAYHPMYEKDGGVQAIDEVRFSIISSRGCFGSCAFCALTFHQGRFVQSRSHKSILTEAEKLTREPDFKGYIHDVGGPTANFRKPACARQAERGACGHRMCLFPEPCERLEVDHKDYLRLLRGIRELPGVKKVFVRSGIRYDYLMYDRDGEFFNELCRHHVSGQLKVAPEHVSDRVLRRMGKPKRAVYDRFVKKYAAVNESLGMKQFLVPYLMSSHPGSDLAAAVELAEYLRDSGHRPEQVQDFYPTPGTLSTCMYYTGYDPRDMSEVYVPRAPEEKAMQRALMQYTLPQNYALVLRALIKAGREDLIGYDRKCLIRPPKGGRLKEELGKREAPKRGEAAKRVKKKKTIRNVHKKKAAR